MYIALNKCKLAISLPSKKNNNINLINMETNIFMNTFELHIRDENTHCFT
ncbi:hypothetical protein DsansV1_C26g0193001 [Dioscorea sansibarensis]